MLNAEVGDSQPGAIQPQESSFGAPATPVNSICKRMSSYVRRTDSITPRTFQKQSNRILNMNQGFSEATQLQLDPQLRQLQNQPMNDISTTQNASSLFSMVKAPQLFAAPPQIQVKIDVGQACLEPAKLLQPQQQLLPQNNRRAAKVLNKARTMIDRTLQKNLSKDLSSGKSISFDTKEQIDEAEVDMHEPHAGQKRGRRLADPSKYCFESQKKIDKL